MNTVSNNSQPVITSSRKGNLVERRERVNKIFAKYPVALWMDVMKKDFDYYGHPVAEPFIIHIKFKSDKDGLSGYRNFSRTDIVTIKNILASEAKKSSWAYPYFMLKFDRRFYHKPKVLIDKSVCVKALEFFRKFLQENPN